MTSLKVVPKISSTDSAASEIGAVLDQGTSVPTSEVEEPVLKIESEPFPESIADNSYSFPAAPKAPMMESLASVAQQWSVHGHVPGTTEKTKGIPTPEELVGVATAKGLDVSFKEYDLADLVPSDFPCMIVDRDGHATVLTGRTPHGLFSCRKDGQTVDCTLAELRSFYTGVVFFIRPKTDGLSHDTAAPQEYVDGPPKGLIASAFHEILQHHRRNVMQLALAAGSSNLLLFAMPIFSMSVYDRVIPHMALESLWALALGVMLALGVDFGLRVARLKLNDAIAMSVTTTLQARYFARILRACSGTIPTMGGSLQSGLREIDSVSQLLPNLLVSVLIDLPFFILASILLFALAGPVAIIPWFATLIALGFQLVADWRNERVRELTRLSTTQANLLVEASSGRETIQTLGAEGHLLRRWERLTDATAYAGHASRLHASMAGIGALIIGQGAVILTIIVSVYEIGAGAMTLGALSAATMLIGRMMAPMGQLGTYLHRLRQAHGSVAIVEKILSAKQEGASDPTAPGRHIAGLVDLRNLSFTYPGEKSPALSNIGLTIRPGEKIGLVGRAGSGKSTLLKLLVRLHDPDSGSMMIDGHDARQFAPSQIRRHFSYMRQDSLPFDDTLRHAICFGLDHVDEEVFSRAVQISGVHEFASRHPSGYGMRVGVRGERLSGGERQSVMMARVLLADAPALLLDEPTASMDNTMEMQLVREMRPLIANKTFVVATHRAALLALVDRLIWMEQGRIVADGPKAEVLKRMSGG